MEKYKDSFDFDQYHIDTLLFMTLIIVFIKALAELGVIPYPFFCNLNTLKLFFYN